MPQEGEDNRLAVWTRKLQLAFGGSSVAFGGDWSDLQVTRVVEWVPRGKFLLKGHCDVYLKSNAWSLSICRDSLYSETDKVVKAENIIYILRTMSIGRKYDDVKLLLP